MLEKAEQDGKNKENEKYIKLSGRFSAINRLKMRDLNSRNKNEKFTLYTKDDISKYLADPDKNQKKIREAVRYIYGASSHFRRIIQYFAGLTDLCYVVEPYKVDPKNIDKDKTNKNYRKVLNTLSSLNVKSEFSKVITVCLREDVFYGTLWITNDNIIIQQLPSDYCSISSIENGVLNVTFNFSYFDNNKSHLEYYPKEFTKKYKEYKQHSNKWIELDSPTSFAIKCNMDIPSYPIPPFAGILREIYDIEDYKSLKLTKTQLENYAMVVMTLPMSKDGDWAIKYEDAKDFWGNLDSVLPEEVGSVLTPMPINKVSFERSVAGEDKTISDAEQNLFTSAGVSSLLFNNEKASANALQLSIKADQAITYSIVKNIENALNRYIHSLNYGKNFKINFLDVSPYNRKEVGDALLKASTYGLPTLSMYAVSQGLGQAELDNMSLLEGHILGLQDLFRPLQNSAQMNSNDLNKQSTVNTGGAPKKDIGDLSDSGEQSLEDKDDWG